MIFSIGLWKPAYILYVRSFHILLTYYTWGILGGRKDGGRSLGSAKPFFRRHACNIFLDFEYRGKEELTTSSDGRDRE